MRILLYTTNYAPELIGIGKYSSELAEWLSLNGHDVRVISTYPHYPSWRVWQSHNSWKCFYKIEFLKKVRIFRCPSLIPKNPFGLKRVFFYVSFAFSSLPILLLHFYWRPKLIILIEPTISCAPATIFFKFVSKTKIWLHIQDFELDAAFKMNFISGIYLHKCLKLIDRFMVRCFNYVSSISLKMNDKIGLDYGLKSPFLFPNWVDTNEIFPSEISMRGNLKIPDTDIVCLYSGSMGRKQGIEVLLASIKLLEHEPNIKFIICGEGEEFRMYSTEHASISNIFWLPLQGPEKFNLLMNAADIHLLPQLEDAADLVMPSKLSAMFASGKPVVAMAQSGTEIFNAVQGRGVAVKPGVPAEFAEAIQGLSQSKELISQYGKAARQFAVEKLDKEIILQRFQRQFMSA